MNPEKRSVLLIEDSASLATVYQNYLRSRDCDVTHVDTGAAAMELLRSVAPNVVLLDLNLPDMTGMEILEHINRERISTATVVITAHGSVEIAVRAMQLGAADFLTKPFDANRLAVTLENVLRRRRLESIVHDYEKSFSGEGFHGFIGASLPMQTIYRMIESAASSKATVFVTGESGTGKEVCAEAIHLEGDRRDRPFVPVNCAAIPKDLMESEIFGHVRGAFTGAAAKRDGAAARADGGTLFLDEICEMSVDLQSKLLRFIQTGTFNRVGDDELRSVDVRFVCATNRNPLDEVRAGRFREDLYYRINVIPLTLPPLRDRGDDVIIIARELLAAFNREENKRFECFSENAERALRDHTWPGNVRELQNVLRNAVVLNNGREISEAMLPFTHAGDAGEDDAQRGEDGRTSVGSAGNSVPERTAGLVRPLWFEEQTLIERAIQLCSGNIPKAAAMLEISASTIYRKRQDWHKRPGKA
ncbi:MAG: sigma-54 dependent transcriptional regulator [Gammaproteobacteria bacterium]|nr:sigma-54 dependent transcriptional regulator [Gammaproteobacteria bacterium]